MQLTLLATPSETILAELYGWGELPIEWISERSTEFAEARQRSPAGPLCLQSNVKCTPDDCSYTHIYMFPAEPTVEELGACKHQRNQMENNLECINGFCLHYVHDGVECFAFM